MENEENLQEVDASNSSPTKQLWSIENPTINIRFDYMKKDERSIPILLPKTMRGLITQVLLLMRTQQFKSVYVVDDNGEPINSIKAVTPGMTVTAKCERTEPPKPITVKTPDDSGKLIPTTIYNASPQIYRYFHDELLPKQKMAQNEEEEKKSEQKETNVQLTPKIKRNYRVYQKENDIIPPYAMTRLIYQTTMNQGQKRDPNSTMAPRRSPRFLPGCTPSLDDYSPRKRVPQSPTLADNSDNKVKSQSTRLSVLKMVKPIVTESDKKIHLVVTSADSNPIDDEIFQNLVKESIFADQVTHSDDENKNNDNEVKPEPANDNAQQAEQNIVFDSITPNYENNLDENDQIPVPRRMVQETNEQVDAPTLEPMTPEKQIKKLNDNRPDVVSTANEEFQDLNIPTSPDPTKCLLSPTVYDLPSENEKFDEGMEEEERPEPEEENMEPLEKLHDFDEEEEDAFIDFTDLLL